MGYLTWGEASSWGMDCNDTETARNFITEWSEIVQRDRNHPSLLIWTPTNEEFWPDRVQYPRLMHDLYNLTKMIDPTRPFHGASGGTHIATDIWTVHNYEQDPAKLKEKLYNGGKLMEAPKWEIHLNPMNIGYNGLKYTDQYAFPEYKKDMPYLIDEFGGIKWNPAQQTEKRPEYLLGIWRSSPFVGRVLCSFGRPGGCGFVSFERYLGILLYAVDGCGTGAKRYLLL